MTSNSPTKVSVSPALAEFFMDQCVGQYSGHMSNIPNNPTLRSLILSHKQDWQQAEKDVFREFLIACAEQLK